MLLPYEWYTCADPVSIFNILPLKELNQLPLLMPDPMTEKCPQYISVSKEADDIAHNQLGTEAPIEETKVARVSEPTVDA
jgi:hypothetical protein